MTSGKNEFNVVIGTREITEISDLVIQVPVAEGMIALNRDDMTTYLVLAALKTWMESRHLECGYNTVLDD